MGVGRGTKYHFSSMFDFESSSPIDDGDNIVNDVKLKDNKIKILNYVIQNFKEIGVNKIFKFYRHCL